MEISHKHATKTHFRGTNVAGTLGVEPGEIRIKHAGVFILGCEITDPTGRIFSFDGPSIEVLAEQELQVSIIEQQVYTGETVQVRTLPMKPKPRMCPPSTSLSQSRTLTARWSLPKSLKKWLC